MTSGSVRPEELRRLLAVDDDRVFLQVIEDHFVAAGWHVTTAESVFEARDAIAVARPDVIVSDILMPEVDGWDFFEAVRKAPPDGLTILVTNSAFVVNPMMMPKAR